MPTRRRNIMLGTAGHVDHGKTAVVKLLTGCDTDTLTEEKRRGMTIDLGFAPCRLADERIVGIVDVPGHVDFIRNMVAGAQGVDLVILVVAADDGVMPQTREHLHILALMGLRHGLVALTKVDLVDTARRAAVAEDIRRLLAGTGLAQAPICPLSTVTGEGYEALFDTLNRVADGCTDRPCGGRFHSWIQDVFTIRGAGTIVTGIPTRGRVRPGMHLVTVPGGLSCRVRQLQVYGEEATEGRAGECVALNLADVDRQALGRGIALCEPDAVQAVTLLEAELQLLAAAPDELKDNAEVHLHLGTAACTTRVALLERPGLRPGERQPVQLHLAHPVGAVPGERFVIRRTAHGAGESLTTVGGGRILGTSNVRLHRRRPWVLASLAARAAAVDDPARWCALLLQQAGRPLPCGELARAAILAPAEAADLASQLVAAGEAVALTDGVWIHAGSLRALEDRLVAEVDRWHRDHPDREGVETGTLRSTLAVDPALFDAALAALRAQTRLVLHHDHLALPGWQARVPDADEQAAARLAERLRLAHWTVPVAADLAGEFGVARSRVEALLALLVERGVAARIAPDLHLHRDAVEAARQVALRLFAQAPSFTTMEFRDALGVSRKYAVPLLDHLDALRVTARAGNVRTAGAEARRARHAETSPPTPADRPDPPRPPV